MEIYLQRSVYLEVDPLILLGPDDPGAVHGRAPLVGVVQVLLRDVRRG